MGEVMTSKYIPGPKKPQHPALSDPAELRRVMKRYDSARLAAKSMNCSPATVTKAMRELAPDLYEALIAQGKARGPKARLL